jgi:hypothetical protein
MVVKGACLGRVGVRVRSRVGVRARVRVGVNIFDKLDHTPNATITLTLTLP